MMMLPKEFKYHLIETAKSMLWDQWENLGAWVNSKEKFKFYSDPEATLVFSEYFSRYEKRFRKISEEWQSINRKHLNTIRLNRIVKELYKKYEIALPLEFKAVTTNSSKFVRELDVLQSENLLLRSRFLFGCSTKSEVIFSLLTKGSSNSNQIARERFLNQKAVLIELDKLMKAGFLIERRTSRGRMFNISSKFIKMFPKPTLFSSISWTLFVAVFILEKCLKDEYMNDDYLIFSTFNDFRKSFVYALHTAMECEIQLEVRTAQEFYSHVIDYWNCLLKKTLKNFEIET